MSKAKEELSWGKSDLLMYLKAFDGWKRAKALSSKDARFFCNKVWNFIVETRFWFNYSFSIFSFGHEWKKCWVIQTNFLGIILITCILAFLHTTMSIHIDNWNIGWNHMILKSFWNRFEISFITTTTHNIINNITNQQFLTSGPSKVSVLYLTFHMTSTKILVKLR